LQLSAEVSEGEDMSNVLTMTGPGASLSQRNMPGHWVLARLGKRVQ